MIKYKYALNDVNEIIDIDNVDKETAFHYLCISCGQQLIPKIGIKRQRHFAHKVNTVSCSKETYLHKLSKEKLYRYLRSCIENNIPFHIKYNRDICLYFDDIICNSCKSQKKYNLLGYYQNVDLEKPSDNFIPDILLESKHKKNQLFIEIAVSHKSSQKKKEQNKVIEILIENEQDIFDIIRNGINENDERISLINFNRSITQSERCNENDCINYIGSHQINENIKKKYTVFAFDELRKNQCIRIQELAKEDYDNTKIMKYLSCYSKEKNNIKIISLCKYYSSNNEYRRLLLVEMRS